MTLTEEDDRSIGLFVAMVVFISALVTLGLFWLVCDWVAW
jgi:hypothetical protein